MVWLGLASGMVVCVRGVVRSSLTVGDAVLFVTMMNQLYVPLTFFGSYYRQVRLGGGGLKGHGGRSGCIRCLKCRRVGGGGGRGDDELMMCSGQGRWRVLVGGPPGAICLDAPHTRGPT